MKAFDKHNLLIPIVHLVILTAARFPTTQVAGEETKYGYQQYKKLTHWEL